MASKKQGLILTLEGAPNTPHIVEGVAGLYRPNIPTPLGAITDAEAKRIDSDPAIPLALAPIDDERDAANAAESALSDSRNVQRQLRRKKTKGGESAQLADEIDATKGA